MHRVKNINDVSVQENIVNTHNVFSVEVVNNDSGQHKYVEILFNIPIQMLVYSGSNIMLIPMVIFNKIKNKCQQLVATIERLLVLPS